MVLTYRFIAGRSGDAVYGYQIQLGRPNSAYLLSGTASRKAIAAGLHREMPSHANTSSEYVQKRRLTFWSFCVFEYMICHCLGRPSCISEEDITIQPPSDEFIMTMARLTKIIRNLGRLVYGIQERGLGKIWEASQGIQEALNQFEKSLPERLKFKADNGSPLCCQNIAHFFLGNTYYHTVILQFPSFLIFQTARQRSGNSTNHLAWLEIASYLAMPITKVRSSLKGILLFCARFEHAGGRRRIPKTLLALVRYGLNCLAQMLPNKWEALSHSYYAIEHMVTLLTKEKAMMKSDHPFLGMKAPGEHEREAENIKIQAGLDALAQETFERHETKQEILLKRISDLESLLIRNIELTSTSSAHDHAVRSPVSHDDLPLPQDESSETPVSKYTYDNYSNRNSIETQRGEVGRIITSLSGHVRYVPYSTSRDPDVFHSLQSRSQLESPSGAFLFTDTLPSTQSLLDTLPPFRHCDELLAVFFDVFSPLFHILHDGTLQSNYARFKQDPRNAPTSFIGLIFVVLGLAVTAIDKESPVLADLGREASTAESHNLHTLQCLILLIYAINHAQGPAWALLGTTLNIAIAIGCHVDPALLNLHPIEVQERRRAWAGLMMLYTIQNTCLGNLAPFQVENNVQLPADVEDDEIVSGSLHEAVGGSEPPSLYKNPTKMSYILYKFRLYSLASDICALSTKGPTPCAGTIGALDDQLQTEMNAQAERFGEQLDLPTYHQAHSFILNNYTNHLVLLLHRICLLKPEGLENGVLTRSYEKCEQAALAMLSNYKTLNLRHKFKSYSWYIHGLGSFHAFLAISTLLVLLGKPRTPQNSKHVISQAVQSCFQRFHDNAPHSEICNRACSILDPLMPEDVLQLTPLLAFSDGCDSGYTGGVGSSNESMTIGTSAQSDNFDPNFWSLPESFEDIVSKIPCEQWLSPAGFPWTN
ncbi:hypothetical protein N7455_010762 [Penicillium solitum]|uniref:uncharacterized protein n=1 Tax=Penicillium solitum TaxID=60172 RepID=UPI0032C492C2|nr:hypothetical protein N7455_010762 [Penicillium solitum]